jgi:hypothetical protein
LVVIQGENVGRKYDLRVGSTTIGASEDNDICVRDEGVSRRHACIVRDDDGVTIRDVGSTNGTYGVATRKSVIVRGITCSARWRRRSARSRESTISSHVPEATSSRSLCRALPSKPLLGTRRRPGRPSGMRRIATVTVAFGTL